MNSRSPRPMGFALCVVAMAVLAAPTLVFPADSPTGPRLIFGALGGVCFAVAVLLVRKEPAARGPVDRSGEDVTENREPEDPPGR
ncbi:hypothetical protein SAMN04487788_2773 [Microbacterium testaceum StLB037]|uniref:Secreted protein n=1 Tax=Microbacterium testaceum (strain StLB037) TaxID=979556 RepID=A0A1H0RBU8_MICTS|nr:hypothetical protein SAMN04487788_2773 [Microbacterium testaceum StLB037]